MFRIVAAVFLSVLMGAPALAGGHLKSVPDAPDPDGRYIFYLHGGFLESNPDGASHPRSGVTADWSGIVSSLVERGFYVFSEIRSQGTRPGPYAQNIAGQIGMLLRAGVAPERITVAGHSKGGAITLITSAIVNNPRLNFINLAGCGSSGRYAKQYQRFVRHKGAEVKGRLLSVYDSYDEIAGSCAAIKDTGAAVEFSEVVLKTSRGHDLFYGPEKVWIDEIEKFAKTAS